MKTVYRWTLALSLGWYAAQGQCAERLGGISDETAPTADQSQAAEENKGDISYRVICSPEGEMLPECEQPPVRDSWVVEPPKSVVPEMPVGSDVQELTSEQAPDNDQSNDLAEAAPPKQASSHKKRSKKTAKKSSKKTPKSEKKRKRH